MTVLFMGGEMGGFVPSSGSVFESTAAGKYDANFSRCGVECEGTVGTPDGSYAETASWAAQTAMFLHFAMHSFGSTSSGVNIVELLDGSDVVIVRLRQSTGPIVTLQYRDSGGAYVTVGSGISLDEGTLHQCDIHVDKAASTVSLYVSGTQRAHTTAADLVSMGGCVKARFISSVTDSVWSQVVADTVSTIGGRLATYYVSSDGATSQWTGLYSAIDEIVYNDADFILSGTAAQVSTYGVTGPSLTGYSVRAVGVAFRAKRGASGPQNIQGALRASGTNYFGSTLALGVGYTANVAIWETNPATGVAFLVSEIAALQPGVKSIA